MPAESRLDALSGLRFLAIADVVCYHVGGASFEGAPVLVETFRTRADVLMPMFFVLSGFVLTYRYCEPIASGNLGARAFWISRLLRLWPIYLVALLLRMAVHAVRLHGLPIEYVEGAVSQAFMLQGLTPPLVHYGNVPGWTVSVEVFCYLLFPWLVVRMPRLRLGSAFAIVIALWLLGQMVALAYVIATPDGWPLGDAPFFYDLFRYLPPLHLPSFLAGMLAARVFMADRAQGRRRATGLITLAGFLPVAFALGDGIALLGRHGVPLLAWPTPFTHNGLLTPAWALLIFGLAHGGAAARWLSARPLVRLGDASYGLYILHAPVFHAVNLFIPDWDKKPLFLVQFFALVLPLSVLSFERFEQPLRNALLHKTRSWRSVTGPR